MRYLNLFRTARIGAIVFFLSVLSLGVHAAISVSQFQSLNSFAPQGSEVPLLKFKVSAALGDETVNVITIDNTASTIKFGSGIDRAFLYLDDGDSSFDSDDAVLKTLSFSGTPTEPVPFDNLDLQIASGNSATFFIVYEVSSSAPLGDPLANSTMNVHLQTVVAESETIDLTATSNKNFHKASITGISSFITEDVSPTIVIPGDELIPMLRLTVTAQGEDINEGQDELQITVKNEAANFVVSENSKAGITKAHLYTDQFEGDSFTPTTNPSGGDLLLQTLNITDFDSTSQVTFKSPFEQTVSINGQGSARRFYVVYDIGEDFIIDKETKVQTQITGFKGEGEQSGLDLQPRTLPEPNDPFEAFVAGLTFDELGSIVPGGSIFGAGTQVPILEFSLFAFHTDVTVNTIILQNTGTIDYITDASSTDGINRIQLFEDTNEDGDLDDDDSDNLIGDLVLGNGNQSDRALIPLGSNGQTDGIEISTFVDDERGYGFTNEKKIFVVYTAGVNLAETTDPNGNFSNAIIENIIGSSNVLNEVISMNALGELPASAIPTAQVVFEDINMYIVDSEDISPTFALRGQVKVPMLYLNLQARFDGGQSVDSANITIENENQSFKADNTGVSKVWLYRDEDGDKVLDDSDTLLSARTMGENADRLEANLSSVPFSNGEHKLMVLYDVGLEAVTDNESIRAEVKAIESNGTIAILLGGELPSPKESAKLTALDKRLSIALEGDSGATAIAGDLRTTFNFKMTVVNTSSENVSLTSIQPAFYSGSVSGIDISTEFNHTISSLINLPVTINSGQTQVINFAANHQNPETQGSGVLDVLAEYEVKYPSGLSPQTARLIRYQGSSNFQSGATQTIQLSMTQPQDTPDFWDFPSYIEDIKVEFGGSTTTFNVGDAVQAASNLLITLRNDGETIDDASISIQLNGTDLERRSTQGTLPDGTFSYDLSTGVIRVQDLGDTDGSLTLDIKDLQGNELTQTALTFKINPTSVQISDLLVYPNPFLVGSETLQLGYNLTRDVSTVKVYIYNYLGQLVHTIEDSTNTELGYNIIEINAFEGFLKSGMYLIRAVAEDTTISNEEQSKSMATTRFAVY